MYMHWDKFAGRMNKHWAVFIVCMMRIYTSNLAKTNQTSKQKAINLKWSILWALIKGRKKVTNWKLGSTECEMLQ